MLALLATLILTPALMALLYRATLGAPARVRIETEQGKSR